MVNLPIRIFCWRFDAAGYDGFIGAEYRPAQSTEAGLGWLETAKGWQK